MGLKKMQISDLRQILIFFDLSQAKQSLAFTQYNLNLF